MGQPSSKSTFPQSRYYTVLDYKYCRVWKRRDNLKETMQQYQVCIQNQQELTKYQKMWQIRTQQQDVVNVYYFNHYSTQQICSLSKNASILTERIPYRLSQFRNIPYQEMVSIMRTCLKVFKILYVEYGLFKVKSTMLGINCQRKLKVWHHTDFSNPQPENSNCKSLIEMIHSIVNSIQLNADQPFEYVRFSQFLDVNKDRFNSNFDQVLQVLQTYRKMNKIPFSESLPEIKFYMRKVQGQQESFNSYLNTNYSRQPQFNLYSPQRQLISSQGFSPAHIITSSVQKSNSYNRALKQSGKTVKRNPSINIYTHKDINRILDNQKELSNYFIMREQRLNSPSIRTNLTPPKVFQSQNQLLYQHFRSNFRVQPQFQGGQMIYRGNQVHFRPFVNKQVTSRQVYEDSRRGLNSIQKRIQNAQGYSKTNVYYRGNEQFLRDQRRMNGTDRTGRFEISTIRSNSPNNSKSKQSSFIFL